MSVGGQPHTIKSTRRKSRVLVLFGLGLIVILAIVIPIRAMVRDLRDSSTGFTIDSRFSPYYKLHGGEAIFGDPISDAFIEVSTGKIVQYFENARLELEPDSSGGMEVKTSSLGMMLGKWEAPLNYDGEVPGCRFYHETGHRVCHAFLDYYEANGGPEIFGYPISEIKLEDDRMVQYFQWFRLDWSSEEGADPVQPGPIGSNHLASASPADFKPDSVETSEVQELIVISSVESASMNTSGEQTVYLLVRDQDREAIEGAAATLIAHFPDGDRMMVMPLTDENGRSQLSFSFENQPTGRTISLEITVVYQGRTKRARESFMIHVSGGNK
jgi:hypothetical protein